MARKSKSGNRQGKKSKPLTEYFKEGENTAKNEVKDGENSKEKESSLMRTDNESDYVGPDAIIASQKEIDNIEPLTKRQKIDTTMTDRENASVCDAKSNDKNSSNFKIVSWNVAGLRAWVKKNGTSIIDEENPDIICLQEIKCFEENLPAQFNKYKEKYNFHIISGKEQSKSGIAMLSKEKPISVEMGIDDVTLEEGRIMTAQFKTFYLVSVYVPNSGRRLVNLQKRLKFEPLLLAHIKKLDAEKPVIYCGDMNVAHNEIDLTNPKPNLRHAGFTKEERECFTNLLKEGYVDTFRHFYPEETEKYTFWTYMKNARAKNIGWRLDYFVLSERLIDIACDCNMLPSYLGSDHCPIILHLKVDENEED